MSYRKRVTVSTILIFMGWMMGPLFSVEVISQDRRDEMLAIHHNAPVLSSRIKEIEGLVRVEEIDPTIVVELRYATTNNFTGKKVYPVAVCVLRRETGEKLAAANAEFKKDGYRIKIWDAYRPPHVQKTFWELVPDERYVANPYKGGSRHNRGGAVDITLVDAHDNELEMPSAFDDFSKRAHPENPNMSPLARQNVDYLRRVMMAHGFESIADEWWHFDDKDWQSFPLVDVELERFFEDDFKEPLVLEFLDKHVGQAILVEEILAKPQARLMTWEKVDGHWESTLGNMEAVVGRNGINLPYEKEEGDGTTPGGTFPLRDAFGYEPTVDTGLSYHQVTEEDFWVDDPESPLYNQWVKGQPQAKSFERLKRDDHLYKYAIVIEYNTNPVIPYKGSAIFIHVWRGPEEPTTGCVALSEENILQLLKWLDKSKNPVIILGDDR